MTLGKSQHEFFKCKLYLTYLLELRESAYKDIGNPVYLDFQRHFSSLPKVFKEFSVVTG